MADMWKMRAPPVSLSFEGIKNGTFTLHGQPSDAIASNGANAPTNNQNGASTNASGAALKDQKTLTLQDNLELFISR
jgi:ubiquitin-like 1-activating enzyme E1 B